MKSTWEPDWISEACTPAFMGGPVLHHFGGKKYFWGNVPAVDVIQLLANEDVTYGKDLRLLFAGESNLSCLTVTSSSIHC